MATPEEEQHLSSVNPLALQNNRLVLTRFRIVCALFSGCASGILGVQGLLGFGLYFVQHFVTSALLLAKTSWAPGKFFYNGRWDIFMGQLLASETFMTYLLLWTMFFNIAHIF